MCISGNGHFVDLLKLCTGEINIGCRHTRLGNWIGSRGTTSVKAISMTGGEGTKKGSKKKVNEGVNAFTNQKSIASFFGGSSKTGTEKTTARQPSITSFFANDECGEKVDTSKVRVDGDKTLSSPSSPHPMSPAPPTQRKSSGTASAVGPEFLKENTVAGGAEEPDPKVYLRRKRRIMVGADHDEDSLFTPTAPSCPNPGALAEENNVAKPCGEDEETARPVDASTVVEIPEGECAVKKRKRLYKAGDLSGELANGKVLAAESMLLNTEGECEGKARVSGSHAGAGEAGDRSNDDMSGESGEGCDVESDQEGGGGAEVVASAKTAAKIRKRKVVSKRVGGPKAKKVEGVSDGLVALAVKSKDYDAAGAATWKPGERVPFSYLAQALEDISKESKRLAITEVLCNVFRTVMATSPEDLLPVVYLVANRVAPPHEGVEMGIGDATIIKALAEATGRKEAQIKSEYKECGDLGLVAKTSRTTQRTMFTPQPLTCAKLLDQFREIAKESGSSSGEKKKLRMKALIVAARDNEPKFIVRLLQGKMRIGLAEQTVLAALAQAAVMQEEPCVSQADLPSRLDEAQKVMKEAYHLLPVVELLVKAILEGGVRSLPDTCHFTLGVPVGPMLAKPTKGISEILDKFQDTVFTCEYKYDGERAQIHCMEDGTIEIYSRNAERNTQKFPDLVAHLSKHKRPGTTSFVLDCEAVAYDREKERILPFQVLSTRGRKGVLVGDIKVQVCLYAFDLLYLNGRSLLQEQLNRRRELLYGAFEEVKGEFQFATAVTTRDIEEIQTFLNEAVNSSCEGVMVKTLEQEATYEPAKRSNNWLKLKKDYMGGLGDSLDLVPIGGFHGKGKRAGVFGAFLLACYDESAEEYQSICKVGTGFSELILEERSRSLGEHVREAPAAYYRCADSMAVDVWFDPCQVWEVRAADLSISPVHRAAAGIVDPTKGIALRFPRFLRVRDDKKPELATTAEQVADMYRAQKIYHPSTEQADEG